MTRESCFAISLVTWLAGPPLAILWAIFHDRPDGLAVQAAIYAAFFIAIGSLVLAWYLMNHVPFVIKTRDSLCSWGTGIANFTIVAYFVALPAFMIGHAQGMVKEVAEEKAYEADAPNRARREREAAIEALRQRFRIDEDEASALIDEADGDEVKATLLYRKRQAPIPSSALPPVREAPAAPTTGPLCPECSRQSQPGKPLCIYCGARLVAKVPCPSCERQNPPTLTRCQYCGGSMRNAR